MSRQVSDIKKGAARPVARMAVLEMTDFEDDPIVPAAARAMTDFDDEPAVTSAARAMTDFEDGEIEVAASVMSSSASRLMTDFDDGQLEFDFRAVSSTAAPMSPDLARLARSMNQAAIPAAPDIVPATVVGRWKQRFEKVRGRILRRDLPGWSVSLALHTAILLALLATRLPGMPTINLSSVISTVLPDTSSDDTVLPPRLEELAFKAEVTKQFGSDSDINTGITGGAMATLIGDNPGTGTFSPESVLETVRGPGFKPSVNVDLTAPPAAELLSNVNVKGTGSEHAGGLEGAIDRLAFEIGASLRERKTLVIWMFDASLSLHDRRDKIAERFENVYRQLRDLDAEVDKSVKTAVMWYGERYGFVTQEPVDDIRAIVDRIREIPDDKLGRENVYAALQAAHKKFGSWGKASSRNVMFIIVTDEKGDDEHLLEQTIHLCRVQARAKCFVVGNAAPFGRQKGYIHWRYEDGVEEDLEVDQGPETILPEALQLGFWGNDTDRFNRMSSSYGPYGLTRLCAETGGLFLITEEDRRSLRFDSQIMRNYAPDYRPIAEYMKGIEKNKAKSSLVAAAMKTKLESISLPRLDFRADNDGRLREQLTEAQKPAAEMDYRLMAMHTLLQTGVKDRDKLTESRWKAGYDLAMGRVLAMRVRVYGFNKLLAEMKIQPKAFQNKDSDQWQLNPSDEINAGPEIKKMAKEAEIYLKRVVDEHQGTPWAMMAERELATHFGWKWQEASVGYARRERERAERERRGVRLADDEKQKKQMRQRPAERQRPKL